MKISHLAFRDVPSMRVFNFQFACREIGIFIGHWPFGMLVIKMSASFIAIAPVPVPVFFFCCIFFSFFYLLSCCAVALGVAVIVNAQRECHERFRCIFGTFVAKTCPGCRAIFQFLTRLTWLGADAGGKWLTQKESRGWNTRGVGGRWVWVGKRANEDADGVDATRRNMAGKLQNSRENKIKKHSHIFQFGDGQSSKTAKQQRDDLLLRMLLLWCCCSCSRVVYVATEGPQSKSWSGHFSFATGHQPGQLCSTECCSVVINKAKKPKQRQQLPGLKSAPIFHYIIGKVVLWSKHL